MVKTTRQTQEERGKKNKDRNHKHRLHIWTGFFQLLKFFWDDMQEFQQKCDNFSLYVYSFVVEKKETLTFFPLFLNEAIIWEIFLKMNAIAMEFADCAK